MPTRSFPFRPTRRLPRTVQQSGPAVAAMTLALAAIYGIGGMIEGFRGAVEQWLGQSLSADYYLAGNPSNAHREQLLNAPGVDGVSRFEEKDMNFFICFRAMLHAMRNDREFIFFNGHGAVAELHVRSPRHYQEKLVLHLVFVPDELALQFDQAHVLAVEFTHNIWIPMRMDESKLLFEIHLVHG